MPSSGIGTSGPVRRPGGSVPLWAGIVAMAVVGVGGLFMYGRTLLQPLDARPVPPTLFRVSSGESANAVGQKLQAERLIRSVLAFHVIAYLAGDETKLKAGTYLVSPSSSPRAILHKIASGAVAVHRVTFPEGLTLRQMSARLAASGVVQPAAFMQASHQLKNPLLPASAKVRDPAEGFLFPATYRFPYGMKAKGVVDTMFAQFQSQWTKVAAKAATSGFSEAQIVTLASIVQLEASDATDRAHVAAVFENRLKAHMKLQSDVTVAYAAGVPAGNLAAADFRLNSAYNTYVHVGLPPGPICNPGLGAIEAVLNAPKVKDLYFVSTPGGGFIFSQTYPQQLKAERQIKQGKS